MIFITGANGLVGSFIAKELLKEGHSVLALKRKNSDLSLLGEARDQIEWVEGDVFDLPLLENCISRVSHIVHCAAVISFHSGEKDLMYQTNVEGTRNLVDISLKYQRQIQKFLFVSSVAAIGRGKEQVALNEESKWEENEDNSHYAKSKHLAEQEVWRSDAEGLKTVIINPSVVLGPGDWEKSSIRIFQYVWKERPFYPLGSMNYVDVRDVADLAATLLLDDTSAERFILNAGTLPFREFMDKTADQFSKRKPYLALKPWLTALAWRFLYLLSLFTRQTPFVTRESARLSAKKYIFENLKIKNRYNYSFRELDETIAWTCRELIKKYSLSEKT